MKIYEAIIEDHNVQRNLCDQLLKTAGASDERKKLWDKLKKELEVHAVAEERHFYSALIDTDKMQEDARHGMAEHHEMDDLIQELEDSDMTSASWMETIGKLIEKVNHHLKDEENDFFKKAKFVYSEDEATALAKEYKATMLEYRKSWPESIPGN
jgi:hemerythrin superfamily protein